MPLTEAQVLSTLSGIPAQPLPPAAAPTPQEVFQLPVPEPPRRFFSQGTQNARGRFADPFYQQEQYREAMMEQQAEAQARRLAETLGLIDPASEQAAAARYNAVVANPLALQSATGKAVLSAFDQMRRDVRQPDVQDDTQDILDKLYLAGATDADIMTVSQGGRLNRAAALGLLGRMQNKPEKTMSPQAQLDEEIKQLQEIQRMYTSGLAYDPQNQAAVEARLNALTAQRLGLSTVGQTPAPQPQSPLPPATTGQTPASPEGYSQDQIDRANRLLELMRSK